MILVYSSETVQRYLTKAWVILSRLKCHVLKTVDANKQIAAGNHYSRHYQSSFGTLGSLFGLVTRYLMPDTHNREFAVVCEGNSTLFGDYRRKFKIHRFSLPDSKRSPRRHSATRQSTTNRPDVIFDVADGTHLATIQIFYSFGENRARLCARDALETPLAVEYLDDDSRKCRGWLPPR